MSIRKHRMRRLQFPIREGGIFRSGKEINGLRGGVPGYAAQESPKIDTARAEKDPFRTETCLEPLRPYHGNSEINKKKNCNSRCNVNHRLNSFTSYFLTSFRKQNAYHHARDAQEKHSRQPGCRILRIHLLSLLSEKVLKLHLGVST